MPPAMTQRANLARIPLGLVRGGPEREATLLLTTRAEWTRFATSAPGVRLCRLSFAMAADDTVAVRGSPLPSMPGERFVEADGIAAPAGFTWSPAVGAAVLRRLFAVSEGGLALWRVDGTVTEIRAEQFVPATRSAARLSPAAAGGDE